MALVIQDSVSIAANAATEVLANFRNAVVDPASRGAVIRISYTASAIGLEADAFVGQRSVIEQGIVSIQNRIPLIPDDVVASNIPGRPNERVTLTATNTTGGALVFFFRLEVEEV